MGERKSDFHTEKKVENMEIVCHFLPYCLLYLFVFVFVLVLLLL